MPLGGLFGTMWTMLGVKRGFPRRGFGASKMGPGKRTTFNRNFYNYWTCHLQFLVNGPCAP
jgi:hypothetical protein